MLKTLCRSQQTGKLLGLPVQGDEVEGCVLIFCKSSNIATSCWTTINRRMLKFIRKRYPHPKTKKKLQWDGRRGTITTKPNLIPSGWVTHRLENNNTKEVLILLWRFWIPHQSSQTGDLTKELGTPREYGLGGHWDLIISLPVDWGKQRLQSWRAKTTFFFFLLLQERSSDLTRDWTGYQLVLEGPPWRRGSAGAHHRNGALEGPPWSKPFWSY